jgi:hypothetical protein
MGDKSKNYSDKIDDLMLEKMAFDAWASEALMYTRQEASKLAKSVLSKSENLDFDSKREALAEVGIWSSHRRTIKLKGKECRLSLAYRNMDGEVEYLSFGVEGKAGEIDGR